MAISITPDLFSPDECERIKTIAVEQGLTRSAVASKTISETIVVNLLVRTSKSTWIPKEADHLWLYQKIYNHLSQANKDLDHNYALDGVLNLQYLEYGIGGFFRRHTDTGSAPRERKYMSNYVGRDIKDDGSQRISQMINRQLSMSIQLSSPDEYKGGTLTIFHPDHKQIAPKNIGSSVVFPSDTEHSAGMVYWGRRRVLVCWQHGDEKKKIK
jgi:predicted 2-oxoglutarate/Fe(II)-dependent dioxygenase YbiX